MLWQPCRSRSSINDASSSALTSRPSPSLEVSQFWQKTHFRLHHEKKMVPEPRQPRRQSSSPKCANADETFARRPTRHTLASSASRLTWQSRGHTVHERSVSSACSTRRPSSPDSYVSRYAGKLSIGKW